jgi:DNA ligase-4
MGFRFSSLVELLEDLERNRFRKASNASKSVNPDHAIIIQWFNRHDAKIKRTQDEGVAFLSCLFPERRVDRCFNMQETRLASVFGRIYQLGTARLNELRAWKDHKPVDFPSCLASILAQTEMPIPQPGNEVTLEEINEALDEIAANVRSSAPTLRASATFSNTVDILTPILYRLRSTEAKWLVRMLLRSYYPVRIPEEVTMQQFHFLLPNLLTLQNDFRAAMDTLNQAEIMQLPKRVSKADAAVLRTRLAGHLVPRIGVMIKRQAYQKARSIAHCCQMSGRKIMSVEQKYDGEYCQVHIDMSKDPSERIQVFSKSGRDSTQDRIRLHYAIEASLDLQSRSQQCKVKNKCILEGELLIYSRNTGTIQPFHKIRKHIQHGGRFLNHEADSPVDLDEQIMIVYYDILLLDHLNLLERPQEERRRCLERLIIPHKGLAEIGIQHVVDFGSYKAPENLRKIFASCITQRLEGFVLKSCKDPYFSCTSNINGIKLKKDYMTKLGDIADVALIGARFDAKAKRNLGHGELKWNSFCMGCLENKDDVIRFDAKPIFRVIGEVSFMPEHDMEHLNQRGETLAIQFSNYKDYVDVSIDARQIKKPDVLFKTPFVVEILGSGYERAPNATYWTLRHPRLHKLHGDRSITETVSFKELQDMAKAAQTAPVDAISQEDRDWIEKLERADPKRKYILDKSQSIVTTPGRSPRSSTTASLTPLRSLHKASPFAIWSDGSLSPEVANKLFSQESSSPIRIETRSAIKRRCDEEADILRRKKRRQSIPGRAQLQLIGPPSLTRAATISSSSEVRAPRTILINKTPPWCRPSKSAGQINSSALEPPAIFRASPIKNNKQSTEKRKEQTVNKPVREPLREVANISTARGAVSTLRSLREGAQANSTEDCTISQKAPLPRKPALAERQRPPMPTPPSSAEEISKQLQPGLIPTITELSNAECHPSSKTSTMPEEAQEMRTAAQVRCTSFLPSPPVFLASSLRTLPSPAQKTLQAQMWSTRASFTASAGHFLSHVPFHGISLVLLDITVDPNMIARTIHDMMARLLKLKIQASATCLRKGRVLFLDWRVLETMRIDDDYHWSALADSGSKRAFAGCLKWEVHADNDDEGHDGTKILMKVKECFDWKEAIL